MNSAEQGSSTETTLAALIDGGLRSRLGLSSADLQVGLAVADGHLARGSHPEALRVYAALVLCDPANRDFQLGLAACASAANAHHLALQAASALIAIAPRDARGYLLSGRSCLALGHGDEAREDLRDAERLASETGDAPVAAEARRLLDLLFVTPA